LRIALDATYSLGDELSGVGVYSRELLNGLATSGFAEGWDWFYRSPRYWRAWLRKVPSNVRVRRLSGSKGDRTASLFHGLNQRLPELRFRRQVATFHDLFVLSGDYSTREFRERFAAQARDAAAAADLIIAVSAFTASQVEAYLNVPASRIRVIHHGVVPGRVSAVSRAVSRQRPREKVVLCVGAIQRRKNQLALVRAFGAAPRDWTLVLAGSQGYDAEATLREVANSPFRDRIRITGYVSDEKIAEWYAKAGIFAFPSLDEGFGMPALEAMAAGIPVIAGNRSSLPEICGDAALLIDPASDEELANAIELLTRDENLRQDMAVAGRVHASRFRWETAVQHTLAVYKELTST
jgi:glycosyltransferase involved in cell wall biosynthesis